MSSEESGWSLTESDPAVFSALLHSLGCTSLIVDDLYSLDMPDVLASMQPVHALIFLFKWVGAAPGEAETLPAGARYDEDFPGFFAHQVVNNACATIAVLNGVFNIPSLPMGPELLNLRDFSLGMDPTTSGLAITNSAPIRNAHNALSSSANSPFSIDPSLFDNSEKEDAYHFVVYLPVAGSLYELDGLKKAPINFGGWEGGDSWLSVATRAIQSRISSYPEGALEFSLLVVRGDPIPRIEAELATARATGDERGASVALRELDMERTKRQRWEFENSLRRHNFIGLIYSMLFGLAKAGGLEAAIEKANASMKAKREAYAKRTKSK